jgi:hypothetical protein
MKGYRNRPTLSTNSRSYLPRLKLVWDLRSPVDVVRFTGIGLYDWEAGQKSRTRSSGSSLESMVCGGFDRSKIGQYWATLGGSVARRLA